MGSLADRLASVPPHADLDEQIRLTEDAVARALEEIARGIRSGVALERIRPNPDLHTYFHEVYGSVFHEVLDVLIQQRDFGRPSDRTKNRKGKVLTDVS